MVQFDGWWANAAEALTSGGDSQSQADKGPFRGLRKGRPSPPFSCPIRFGCCCQSRFSLRFALLPPTLPCGSSEIGACGLAGVRPTSRTPQHGPGPRLPPCCILGRSRRKGRGRGGTEKGRKERGRSINWDRKLAFESHK